MRALGQPRSQRLRIAVVAVTSALLATIPSVRPVTAGPEEQLADARRQVEELTAELSSARAEAAEAEARVAAVERQVSELEAALNEVAASVQAQQALVERQRAQVESARQEAVAVRAAMIERARMIYMRGGDPSFEVFFTNGAVEETLDRLSLLHVLARRDNATVEHLVATETRLAAATEVYEEQLAGLEAMEAEQQTILDEAVAALASSREVAAASRAHQAALHEQREDLQADSRRLEELIRSRQRPRTSPPSTSGYAWPLCGLVTSEYGMRWGRMHEGIDIDGDTGDPIMAAKDGVVIFAGWQGGYGRLTLIDHGDGVVTAYAHQSSQSVSGGTTVTRGQVIGAVGNTGQSTGSHLHFETRVDGAALNPRRFLPGGCG
jgi:murein DD-endopeptidase MepM/ murein hydrolase activator NlpD